MMRHVKKFHSEATKRKAEESDELLRLELLNGDKVPRLTMDEQIGGAVSTRGVKRTAIDEPIQESKRSKPDEIKEKVSDPNPLFVANVKKVGPAKRWKGNAVVNQKFVMTLDQQRGPTDQEYLNVGATHAIAVAIDRLIEELKIPPDYSMTLQIGSKEHRREGLQGETWKVPVQDFTGRAAYTQALLNNLSRVLNSGEFITNDVGFSASVLFSRPERKGGKRAGGGPGQKLWEKMAQESRCVCEIKNKDDLCCARAVVTMREYAKRQAGQPNTFETIRQDRGENTQQMKEAKKLHQEAGVVEGLCGLDEIEQFQELLGPQGFRIIVVEASRGGVIFKGGKYQDAPYHIDIVKSVYVDDDNKEKAHYDGLYSIPGFINRSYFCYKCCKGYNTEDAVHHICAAKQCPGCKSTKCPDYNLWTKPDRSCKTCGREFYGQECYDAHLVEYETVDREKQKLKQQLERKLENPLPSIAEVQSICKEYHQCQKCHVSYKVNKDLPHKCLHAKCKHCLQFVNIYEHQCYITSEEEKQFKRTMQTFTKLKKKKEAIMGMAVDGLTDDFTQNVINEVKTKRAQKLETIERINRGMTERNSELPEEEEVKVDASSLVFADIECMLDNTNTFSPILICYTRGYDKKMYHHWGINCVDHFIETLKEWTEAEKKDLHIYFHNLKGFDGVLTLNSLYRQNLKVTDQMGTGTKILHFKHNHLIFKDSLSFLNMPLSNFPKTFGITELKKGFFPHKFSTLDNLNYEGRIPDLRYYEPQHMSAEKKKECEEWHADKVREGESWNFKKEMLEYCESDVELLRQGCLRFAEDTKKDAGFNPLTQCITIASTCHYFWRNHQMQPKTIAVEPITGWRGAQVNQSKMALQWLYGEDQKLGGNRLQHTRNGGEKRMVTSGGSFLVDGYDPMTKTVYEFHGCEFHGCPKCKKQRHVKTWHHPDRTVEETYHATLRKSELLRQAGYTVIEMWECEFKNALNENKELKAHVERMTWVSPLDPREAFYGGRTGMTKCYHEVQEGEEIHYVDVTSLYPWVNKYGTYPIGHPHIIVNPTNQNIGSYFGIAKVDVLAPERLLHPVLPVKLNEKLLFPLCKKCVEDQADLPWHHRSCRCRHSDEERTMTGTWSTLELQKAVELGYKILKIHEVWHWSEHQRKTGLFAPYVNKWLKYKTEASGWPAWCDTDEKKAEYVRQYNEHEGIQLDYDSIKKNPGKKQVSKLMLNSFWGKFGENELRPQTKTIQDENDWQKLLQDDDVIVKDVRIFNDDVMEVSLLKKEDACESGGKVNIFIAVFTTALARLKLYEELDKLKHQVLYYDTDSVIYSRKEGEVKIPTGNFLGDMTDELDGDVITMFASAGPKSYCYETNSGKKECKNKGTKSSYEINQILNCESMKNHILLELNDPRESRRLMSINIKNFFVTDNKNKTVSLKDLVKVFGVNWDKRVVERGTGITYPYGYIRL